MKKLVLALCLIPALLSAQTLADEMDTLLGTSAVTYAQAARFVLEAADVAAFADPAEAFRYAQERNWVPKKASADEAVRLEGLSLLAMHSFGLGGGIMYSLTKNAHFAYRELVYRNMIQGRIDPQMKVPGSQMLFIVGRILSHMEDESALEAEKERRRLLAEEENRQKRLAREEAARASEQEALAEQINIQLSAQAISNASARVTSEGITISLSNIQFLADSAELPEAEKRKLLEIAGILKTIPGNRILVAGHSARAGTVESQIEISRQRAQAVADYLVSLGARSAADIAAVGYGADISVGDNSTPEGMAANRRVEITILEH